MKKYFFLLFYFIFASVFAAELKLSSGALLFLGNDISFNDRGVYLYNNDSAFFSWSLIDYIKLAEDETSRIYILDRSSIVAKGDIVRDRDSIKLNNNLLKSIPINQLSKGYIFTKNKILTNKELSNIYASGKKEKKTDSSTKVEDKIGEPEQDLSQVFLRESSVLLKPRQLEVETFILHASNQQLSFARNRDSHIGLSARYGLLPKLELFSSFDYRWKYKKQSIFTGEVKAHSSGLSDINIGAKYVLLEQKDFVPDIIMSLSLTPPTSRKPDLTKYRAELSSGRWQISPSMSFIHAIDPAVLFASIGYNKSRTDTLSGIEVSGGDQVTYGLGLGISINSQLTLSIQYGGSFVQKLKYDNKIVSDVVEPMSSRISITYRFNKNNYAEIGLSDGLNDDATDSVSRFSFSRRFYK